MPRPLKKAKLAKEHHHGLKFAPAASDSGSDGSMYEKSSSEGDESDEEVRVDAIFLPAKLRSTISSIKAAVQTVTKIAAISEYIKLHEQYQRHPKCKKPSLSASLAIARRIGKGASFARSIRQNELYLCRHGCLPPPRGAAKHRQHTLLDNESVLHSVRHYLAIQKLGSISPRELSVHVNTVIVPALGLPVSSTITECTTISWLYKLGYRCRGTSKGMYFDSHERPDVIEYCSKFLALLTDLERFISTYNDTTLDHIPPQLSTREKEHLRNNEQPIKKKGNGCAVHVSDFICETIGRLALSPEQIAAQEALKPEHRLRSYEACKIIYPGKDHDKWWDLDQLMVQTELAADIFEHTHLDMIGVWGLAEDALNINNMNINPGRKQTHLRDTIIPLSNPLPLPASLTLWFFKRENGGGKKISGKCKSCGIDPPADDWCCIHCVLSLQEDFVTEKPKIQHFLESRGHLCIFLPKFHCELNPIEMHWGYVKYRFRNTTDGRFPTARNLVPKCLNLCNVLTIQHFFRKTWRYIDAYRFPRAGNPEIYLGYGKFGKCKRIKLLIQDRELPDI
ncbi:hypothetical protein FIBSPDRAFT_913191 [Athelia psychrophila]|uniref:Tc1-like transposase DDE domain-containing protein n=1 Tax=Athelia psychrophila TaxID=1759441 RepID=A0A166BS64_9AGAM|nr:hypothetical protein FIBSPDRAFT_913191 [Fibularhizoctonia sp. CBS 109695]